MEKYYLNGKDFFDMFRYGAVEVIKNKDQLNKINVFPVADGDTGNNLAMTLNSVLDYAETKESFYETAKSMAEASLYGARGNSGVIFAQYMSGIASASVGKITISLKEFVEAIVEACNSIYETLSDPVEGTMITVMREWSYYLSKYCSKFEHFGDLFLNSIDSAKKSLANTTNQLEILKQNNVVDSGARGFVYYLEGIIKFIKGDIILENKKINIPITQIATTLDSHKETNFRYCTECILKGNIKKESIKETLKSLGDSIIIAGDENLKHIHIHTNEVKIVFKKLTNLGIINRPKVEDMKLQKKLKNKKGKIALLTDSIGDIPKELLSKYDIHLIPVNIFVGENHYLDKVTINPKDFYNIMNTSKEYPNSSQPNDIQVKQKLDFLKENYETTIALMVSSKLSGTYQSVYKYSQELKNINYRMEIIDSKLNSAAQGLLVTKTAEKIHAGTGIDEILKEIKELIPRTEIYVALNTFKNALKSGRVPKIIGEFGVMFGLKPIISIDRDGKGTAFSIAFSKKRLMNKIKDITNRKNNEKSIQEYAIVYSKNEDNAKSLSKNIEKILGKPPKYICEVSSVTALHVGEGAVAISFIR